MFSTRVCIPRKTFSTVPARVIVFAVMTIFPVLADLDVEARSKKSDRMVYIIEFLDESVLTYEGHVEGFQATSPTVTGEKPDFNKPSVIRYRDYLGEQRTSYLKGIEEKLSRRITVLRTYDVAFFGIAVEITSVEAKEIRMLPGIKRVRSDEFRVLLK